MTLEDVRIMWRGRKQESRGLFPGVYLGLVIHYHSPGADLGRPLLGLSGPGVCGSGHWASVYENKHLQINLNRMTLAQQMHTGAQI